MLLMLSDQFDVHGDIVEHKLRQKGITPFRLNLDVASLQKVNITFDGLKWIIETPQGLINSSQISCVWQRRLFVELSAEENAFQNVDFKIWKGEWNKNLIGLYSSFAHLPWLNPIRENTRAENKYYQMHVAKSVGLNIPSTISSNNKDVLIKFCKAHKTVVTKLLNQDIYQTDDGLVKGIYVNQTTLEDLAQFGDTSENPIVLQQYINKGFEVRYTVIGDAHFACKIDSQLSQKAHIDWRRYDLPNTPHSAFEAPDGIKRKVASLMNQLGLSFGALDFIVSPENEWFFLEVNPNGQWLWIEDLTGMPISETISIWLQDKIMEDDQ